MNVDTKMESRLCAEKEYKLNSFVKWVDFLPLAYLICSYVLKYIKTVKTCVLCQKLYTIKRTHKNIKKKVGQHLSFCNADEIYKIKNVQMFLSIFQIN